MKFLETVAFCELPSLSSDRHWGVASSLSGCPQAPVSFLLQRLTCMPPSLVLFDLHLGLDLGSSHCILTTSPDSPPLGPQSWASIHSW